jgi:folate-binding protein YgfZ
MPNVRFTPLPDRGILAVSGDDRASFLQGLVSNDTMKLAPGRAMYAALLTAQGKYLHDFIMIEQDGAIRLDAEAARIADLKRRLSMYRLRAKVVIEDLPDLAVAAVFGGNLPDIAFPDPRLPELGGRVILPRDALRSTLTGLGLAEADFAEYDRLRLGLGIPDGSRDLVVDKSILLESGFDELHGVDWQKGCYIGQELTARTKYRGLIKKRLFPVQIDGPAPEPGTILTLNGKEAGEMRSSLGDIGLALVRLENADAPLAAGDTMVRTTAPKWMRVEAD